MGYKIAVAPIESLLVTVKALRELVETFREDGSVLAKRDAMIGFGEIKRILGVERYLRLPNTI
jgi:2-methylisocitrate lyase-like PEP mutase family enzyme